MGCLYQNEAKRTRTPEEQPSDMTPRKPKFGTNFLYLINSNKMANAIKNVVLIHGAFADGSGWRALWEVLAAWKDKPAFACIATEDKSIDPPIQYAMYKRSNTSATGEEAATLPAI